MAWRVLYLAFLVVAALGARALPAAGLLDGSRVLPFPDDPPYHWMRLERLLEGPVSPGSVDPMLAHPNGAVGYWPWGFDHLLEVVASVAGAGTDAEAARRATAWAVALLGALLVWPTYLVAARMTSRRRALLAATLIAVLPAHVEYTLAGRVDHHVMEPMLTVLALLGPLLAAARAARPSPAAWMACAASGLASGLAFSVYPAALHPVAMTLVLAGGGLALEAPGPAAAFALATLAGQAASLPMSPYPSEWFFYSPGLVHVALIGIVVAGVMAVACATRLRPGWRVLARLGAGAGVAAIATLAAGLALPDLVAAIAKGLSYIGSHDFTVMSHEAKPLLKEPRTTLEMLGVLSPLAPVGLLLLARRGRSDTIQASTTRRAIALLGFALLSVALVQRRFVIVAVPFVAIGAAEGLGAIGGFLANRLGALGVRRTLLAGGGLAIVVAGLVFDLSTVADYRPLTARDRAMLRAAEVLASRNRDVPSPGAGALVPWGYGHLFQWAAHVPTVCDNFFGTPESDAAMRECLDLLYETRPTEAGERLRRDRVRWIVLLPPHPDQVRAETALMGRDPDQFVDAEGRLRPAFARTAWGLLGRWAQSASPGDEGPLGFRLLDRILEFQPGASEPDTEVLVFETGETLR